MSSKAPTDNKLSRLLANVLADTPTVDKSSDQVRQHLTMGTTRPAPGNPTELASQVNRLTFTNVRSNAGSDNEGGTSDHQRVDSLFIDLTSAGMESSDGGFQMMSARSTGNSTIDTVLDVNPLKYQIFVFPISSTEMLSICQQRQSGGVTACIRTNCRLNHRGPKVPFKPGMIVVGRSSGSVFIEPKIDRVNISESLVNEWKQTAQTLDEWNEMFRLVNVQESDKISTPASIREYRRLSEAADGWKSPLGQSSGTRLPFGEAKSQVFIKLVEEQTDELMGTVYPSLLENLTGENLADMIKRLDIKAEVTSLVLSKMAEKIDEHADIVTEEFAMLLTRIQKNESVIGVKVQPANSNFDAPTVWSSVATIGAGINEVQSALLAARAESVKSLVELEKRIAEAVDEQFRETFESATMILSQETSEIKDNVAKNSTAISTTNDTLLLLARGAAKLKDEVTELRQELAMLKMVTAESAGTSTTDDTSVLSDISSIKVMLKSMGQRIDTVVEGRENKSIKFFGLTFRGHGEAESWVSDNLDSDSYGLIVDAHLALEHVYQQAFSDEGAIKELNVLYKIKIDNIAQSLAISSFDYAVPRFFSAPVTTAGKKPKIKKPDSSHFDNIDSFEDWDLPIMGFRAKLKEELEDFEETHLRMIGEILSTDAPAYRIATMSVQASVTWIQSFITYLDETYMETSRLQSFTPARAWQLVTQIGRRILNEVGSPRIGVRKLFRVGDNAKIAQAMFWPMVQSHEIMSRFKKANFKDDPAISNEFMKFLATNSGSTDGLAPINSKLTKLESEIKESAKVAKGASTSATNSANKADEVKKTLTSLIQRITILEKQGNSK